MQHLHLSLAFLLLATGCRSGTGVVDVPSVWGPGSIRNPDDARREVSRHVDRVVVSMPEVPDPRLWTLDAPEGEWRLRLSEALAIAMTNSPIVRTLPANQNLDGERTPQAARPQTNFDPTIEANRVEAELGRFDAVLGADAITQPVLDPLRSPVGGRLFESQDRALVRGGIRKPTVLGGEAAIDLGTDYRYLPEVGASSVNPQYQPDVGLRFRQQLRRGAGQAINLAPIVIVAAEAEQSSWEFHDAIQDMTRSIEANYWALYSAQAAAKAIRDVIPMLQEVVRVAAANVRADVAIPADLAQAQSELLNFQREHVEALLVVRNREALLRELLGIPPNSLEPIAIDTPSSPIKPVINWEETLGTAMQNRPDIMRERLSLYIAQRATDLANNQALPEVQAFGGVRLNGLGDDLGSALDLLGEGRYVDWSAGLSYSFPVGNHTARARQRSARLLYARERARLKEVVYEAVHELSRLTFEANSLAEQYALSVQRQTEVQRWLNGARARYMNPSKDMSLVRSLDLYLRAIREASEVEQEVARLTAQYHVAMTKLEEAKGTLLAERNIMLQDDPRQGVRRMIEFDPEQPIEPVPFVEDDPPTQSPERSIVNGPESMALDENGTDAREALSTVQDVPQPPVPERLPTPRPDVAPAEPDNADRVELLPPLDDGSPPRRPERLPSPRRQVDPVTSNNGDSGIASD
jgi:outer membrane protein TolC